jgi:hypothetical protein
MAYDDESAQDVALEQGDMVGIVVQAAREVPAHPHLDFVWGPPGAETAPSLPFGRWKPAVRAA